MYYGINMHAIIFIYNTYIAFVVIIHQASLLSFVIVNVIWHEILAMKDTDKLHNYLERPCGTHLYSLIVQS